MIETIKGFAADIDMTLTNKGEGLPQITQDALKVLHDNGVLIGLATGRCITDAIKEQGKTWGLPFEFDFVVCLNGGQVYDRTEDHFWSVDMLTQEEMKTVLNYMMPLIDKYKISVNAEGGNRNAMNIQGELLASAKRHGFDFIDKTGDIDGFCDTPCFKMLFRLEPKYEQEIRDVFLAEFSDEYQMIGTFPGTVEVMKKGINKGTGLARYAEWKGLSIDDFITFGDNENDNAMLEMSGWGVCLKNGAQKTKDCSNAVTEYDCADGGVGHYLYDHYITPKGLK